MPPLKDEGKPECFSQWNNPYCEMLSICSMKKN